MPIALLPAPTPPEDVTPPRTATLALLCSPIRGADGAWRTLRQEVPITEALTSVLPAGLRPGRVIVNGRVVEPDAYATTPLYAGDEVLVVPEWGAAFGLIGIAISLVLSVAISAATYFLFPPAKAHQINQNPDEPTFSFEGIRTAVGPGAVVPVIYGRHRVGGQLLSASVDQAHIVVDNGVGLSRVNAISAPATLSLLLALGEGPVSAIDVSSVLVNGQPLANFPGVEIWTNLGSAAQLPLPGFSETRDTFADGRNIPEVASSITYTTTVAIDAFYLNIVFNGGLYAFNPKGDKVDNVVTLQTRFRLGAGSWGDWSVFQVAASRTSVVRFGIRRENLELGIYTIELQVTNVQSVTNAEWQPTLESVTEVQQSTQAYPYTALLGLRALATDALPNITVEVDGRLVRVNSFASLDTWSDNPAWCVMDFLTQARYGLGLPDAAIDLAAFQAWAAYCDQVIDGEKRHTLHYVLDRDTRAQPALMEIMAGSRAMLFKAGGLWTPRPTRDDTPVQLLSWSTCTDLKLTYLRDTDRINVMEARFANEDADYQQDVLTWPTLDNWPAEVRKSSLEVRGVTKPSRVMRAMQFELNRRRLENLSLEMTCSLEALTLQPHDLFRFSHPLPGWGVSGRIQAGSNTSLLQLDEAVTFDGAGSYLVYVRQEDDTVEMKPVLYPGDSPTRTITLLEALAQVPQPRTSLYAFGKQVGAADTAVKVFRVVRMQRTSRNQVHLTAIIHNPAIYDEPTAEPLPVTTDLFNPLGPPPGLTSLVLTEVTRIQPSGASLRVVNLSWDVAGLSRGYAPYGGATILRRTVLDNGMLGTAQLGTASLGLMQAATDTNVNFQPVTQVRGHVLDFDDYTVLTGITYVYRVEPVSSKGVPNLPGAREAVIHVAGPTTPDFFPGTVLNLRLKGQRVGDTIFEGRDIHIEWDPIGSSTLFSETFFVQDYIVEVWAPAQLYLLRRTILSAGTSGQAMTWTYTLEQNGEDSLRNGQAGAQRTVLIMVWARTNTGRVSLDPAQMTVTNPPPDMSNMIPEITALFQAALEDFSQFVEPRDFDHYEIHLDTVNPPLAIYNDIATSFSGTGISFRKVFLTGLTAGLTYYTYILPYDTFGPGLQTQTASFVPAALDADSLDTIPPAVPTGLTLTTGTTLSADGTIMPFVQADWALNTEADIALYEVHLRIDPSTVPTVFTVSHPVHTLRIPVPGNVTVFVKLLATDRFHNILDAPFTAEVSITTGADTTPPAAPTNLTAIGSIRSINLLWTPPADPDYDHCIVYASMTNNWGTSSIYGTGKTNFIMGNLGANETWYFWLRAVDTSGNLSVALHPASLTAGVAGTAGQLDTTFISSLAVDKLLAGIVNVLIQLGVGGNNIFLDGVNRLIYIYDGNGQLRVELGKLGALTTQYGLRLYNDAGVLMWNFATGATPDGISDSAITASKISAAVINSAHLRTDTAVISTAAQIANALIGDAHITNLAANKILAGTVNVLLQLGIAGSNILLDGPNRLIYIYDQQAVPRLRIELGKVGAGVSDYGLRIYNSSGQLMWNFTDGAQTQGIAPHAVSDALSFSDLIGVTATNLETSATAAAIGPIQPGDQIWVSFKSVGNTIYGDAGILVNLREDDAFGQIFDTAAISVGTTPDIAGQWYVPAVVQAVWTATVALPFKAFAVTFRNFLTVNPVALNNLKMVLLLRRR